MAYLRIILTVFNCVFFTLGIIAGISAYREAKGDSLKQTLFLGLTFACIAWSVLMIIFIWGA